MRTILCTLFVLFSAVVNSQIEIEDKDVIELPKTKFENLDSVKEIKVYSGRRASKDDFKIRETDFLKVKMEFDRKQRIKSYIIYGQFEPLAIFTYKYPNSEKTIVEFEYDEGRKLRVWEITDSLIQECNDYKLNGSKKQRIATWKYEYLNDSLMISLAKYNADFDIIYQMNKTYSSTQKLIRATVLRTLKPAIWIDYTYNDNGKLIESEIFNSQNAEVQYYTDLNELIHQGITIEQHEDYQNDKRVKYEYNDRGLNDTIRVFNREGVSEKIIFRKYDKNENKIAENVWVDDQVIESKTWKYDEHNYLLNYEYFKHSKGNIGDFNLIEAKEIEYDSDHKTLLIDTWKTIEGKRNRLSFVYLYY